MFLYTVDTGYMVHTMGYRLLQKAQVMAVKKKKCSCFLKLFPLKQNKFKRISKKAKKEGKNVAI